MIKSRSTIKSETRKFAQEVGAKTRYCATINCEIEVKRKGGNNAGKGWDKYCKQCRIVRSRAKKAGINPDNINKETLFAEFWFKFPMRELDEQ
jgi:hypothetical protein